MARPDRFGRGGDHSAYNLFGFTAVGFRESRENFARQHDPRDTFEGISPMYIAQNARVNAAAAAELAAAPPAPEVNSDRGQPLINRQPTGYDANLRWTASPGAVSYRIFWRDAWGPDWQHELAVGNVTETILPDMQIDDYVYGVAAVDGQGHESLVAPCVTARKCPRRRSSRSADSNYSARRQPAAHDRFDELRDHLVDALRRIDEFDSGSIVDHFLIDVADAAVRDAAFDHHGAIAERQPEVVERIELPELEVRFRPACRRG